MIDPGDRLGGVAKLDARPVPSIVRVSRLPFDG